MTRKHFAAIAAAMKACRPSSSDFAELPNHADRYASVKLQWIRTVRAMADVCAAQNAQFRRSTFLDACGFND